MTDRRRWTVVALLVTIALALGTLSVVLSF
jgi:hypothetical protein